MHVLQFFDWTEYTLFVELYIYLQNSLGVIYNSPEHTKGLGNSKRFCYNFSIEPWSL